MNAFTTMILLLLVALPTRSAPVDSLFAAGNEAYRKGEYGEAIRLYEEILSSGVESGELFYNLGAARFREGDLGRAVADYERARRYLPRDADVKANLEYVLERTLDREIARQDLPPLRLAAALAERLTWKEWFRVVETTYAVFLVLLGAFLLRPSLQDRLREWLYVSGGVLLAVCLLFAISLHAERLSTTGVVTESEVPVRSGPGEQFTREFLLHAGTVLRVRREADGWVYFTLTGDFRGWLPEKAIERL